MPKTKKGETVDDETAKILAEMEEAGELDDQDAPAPSGEETPPKKSAAPKAEAGDDDDDQPADDSADEDLEEPADQKDLVPKKTPEKDGEDDDDEDDLEAPGGGEAGGQVDDQQPAKPGKVMPIAKFQRYKTKKDTEIQTLQQRIQELEQTNTQKQLEDEAIAVAKEFNTDPKFLQAVVKLVQRGAKLPENVEQKLNTLEKEHQATAAETRFENDFNTSVLPLIKKQIGKPTDAEIAAVKQGLKELVSSGKVTAPLSMIYLGTPKLRPRRKKGGEPSRPSQQGRGSVAAEDMSLEEINDLPDEEFDKASDELAKKSGSKYQVLNG